MSIINQQEYTIKNLKGETIATTLVSPKGVTNTADEVSQAQYRAGVPQEFVDPVKNATYQPVIKAKK
jgi:GH25 family lysozyme M1 (1,4-beta-N-acetylmuramidase)